MTDQPQSPLLDFDLPIGCAAAWHVIGVLIRCSRQLPLSKYQETETRPPANMRRGPRHEGHSYSATFGNIALDNCWRR